MEELKKNGVTVLKNVYSKHQINVFKQFSIATETNINTKINSGKLLEHNYDYYSLYDKEYKKYKKCYYVDDNLVLELEDGKYDIEIKNVLHTHPKIHSLISQFFTKCYKSNWGILTSNSKSPNGSWHRDVLNICGESDKDGNYDDSIMVHNFEPFYFTVLIPLVELNKNNGTTEFIDGSHVLTYNESKNKKHIQFDTNIGDVIIFDGRIFHRGCANNSNKSRPILYTIYYRNWYNEA